MKKKSQVLALISICILYFFVLNIYISNKEVNLSEGSDLQIEVAFVPGDGWTPPWGDDVPPWGDGEPPEFNGTLPPGDFKPPFFPSDGSEEGSKYTFLNENFIIGGIVALIILPIVAITGYMYVMIKKKDNNVRVIHQLGKRKEITSDIDDLEPFKTYGHISREGIPSWAYNIIHKRERVKSENNLINYKQIPKKLKQKRIVLIEYWKDENNRYSLQTYRIPRYLYLRGKRSIKELHNKLKLKYYLKHDIKSKKMMKYKIQQADQDEIYTEDQEMEIIKQLLY